MVVRLLSHVRPFVTPWIAACQASLPFSISWSSLKCIYWDGDDIQASFLLSPPSPPSLNLSQHQSLWVMWPKYWSFSFNISPSNEYLGLISFRIDWFDLLEVQVTLKSLLQHHILKASILWHSVFFLGQLSHPHMTTGKTKALTLQTFVSKVMSLLFNMLSRFVIAFLPRSKSLLISWLQPVSEVTLEPPRIKSVTASTFPPSVWLPLWLSW